MRAALGGLMLVGATALARPHRLPSNSPALSMPMRIVLSQKGQRFANCIFGASELPERSGGDVKLSTTFDAASPIWGRCFLPDPFAGGDGVDVITVDHLPPVEIEWDRVAHGALSRMTAWGAILRNQFAALAPGMHDVQIEGLARHGGKRTRLYLGSFRYVR